MQWLWVLLFSRTDSVATDIFKISIIKIQKFKHVNKILILYLVGHHRYVVFDSKNIESSSPIISF